MDPHLIPYAERQAPRYTSYPSAPHFDASVDAALYTSWLGALEETSTLSLYLHVPYCRQICSYCGCNTFLTRGGDIPDFVTSMMMEIDLAAGALGTHNVSELHWGRRHAQHSLADGIFRHQTAHRLLVRSRARSCARH
jgi:oxygen-independent coproporphyrinogen-3 oxidase